VAGLGVAANGLLRRWSGASARRLMGTRQWCLFITYAAALITNAASSRHSTATTAVYVRCRFGFGARQFDRQSSVVSVYHFRRRVQRHRRQGCRLGFMAKHFQQQSFPLVAAGFPEAAITTFRRLGRYAVSVTGILHAVS